MSPKEACNAVWKVSPVREIERVELAAHKAADARGRLLAVRPASGSSQAARAAVDADAPNPDPWGGRYESVEAVLRTRAVPGLIRGVRP